jgi:hypothetical protein
MIRHPLEISEHWELKNGTKCFPGEEMDHEVSGARNVLTPHSLTRV